MMNEGQKTVIFAGVAVLVGCVWIFARPHEEPFVPDEIVGEVLFEKFDDPTDAASLEIVRYNEDLSKIRDFKVAKNSNTGLWTIPSHFDYPADAEERIRDVATSLVGTVVHGVVTEDASEHELFGVLEPNKDDTQLGDQGVGMLVSFEDQKGKELASLIVGKPIKGAEGHRFAREPGKDVVYDIEIDAGRFSTKFEEWIEPDLLKVNPLDIETLTIKDYSVLRTTGGFSIDPRFDATCNWNSSDSKWELEEFLTYRKGTGPESLKPIRSELLAGEELNNEKLNELKNALGDLKIIDVHRKPEGLQADLKAETSFLKDQESVNSLVNRGFYPLAVGDGQPELYSANGELHVFMKDGYELVLRFGNVAGTEEDSEESKLSRYLFVTARVNEDKFPKPELEEVPQKQEPSEAPAPPEEAETETDQQAGENGAGEEASADGEETADNREGEADAEDEEAELDNEIKRIEKENQRKLDEWKEKRDKAVENVRELNGRFADWYYVVSEDVYRKIRLSRGDLIKESEKAEEEGFGVDAFRKLEEEGLTKPDDSESTDN